MARFNKNLNAIRLKSIILLLLCLVSLSAAYAITGTAGSITSESIIGQTSYDANTSGLLSHGVLTGINGLYSGGLFSGRLGLAGDADLPDNPGPSTLNISLLSPQDNSASQNMNVIFRYNVFSNYHIRNCSIYIDGALRQTGFSIIFGSENQFSVGNMSIGRHDWNITCTDSANTTRYSPMQWFSAIKSTAFDANSTDLTQVNISSIPNLTLSKSNSKIIFSGLTDLSNGTDLDSNVIISSLSIMVNSSAAPELDKPAILTLYNVPFQNILIWRDGVICDTCQISSTSPLVFNVTGFSNYTVTSTSRLEIYDDTDIVERYVKQGILFTANYSNILSGQPLAGNCTISFNTGGWTAPQSMAYNASAGLYLYTYRRSFNTTGVQEYSVACNTTQSGFDNLTATDTFTITTANIGAFANINATIGPSSRMDVSNIGANISGMAGNITELYINGTSVTKSWQGYYGNITGHVSLSDAGNNKLYDWNLASAHGEVYASRAGVIDWASIRCANITELYEEDVFLGMNSTVDGESITRTFFNTTDFHQFYTAAASIDSAQNCYATSMYTSAGVQNGYYAEILLSDTTDMVYTGLIDSKIFGFDNRQHDFEMIVGENGQLGNTETTIYYFFVEIG